MSAFRKLTDTLSVSPQISVDYIAAAAAEGVTLVINNRPEGESPDQTPGPVIEAAARAAGLDYLAIPVVGMPRPDQVAAQREAIAAAKGKVLAYCRSGTRSTIVWGLGQAGSKPRAEILSAAAEAGYDLSQVIPG
jgi:uncharacterized protein (TIGR01244 family)